MMRGSLVRKKLKRDKENEDPRPKMSYRGRDVQGGRINFGHNKRIEPGANVNSYAKELKVMPDYSNAATKKTEERLGEFIFD